MKRAILYDLNNPKYYTENEQVFINQNRITKQLFRIYVRSCKVLKIQLNTRVMYSELVKLNRKKVKHH